jgi:hypothetical protein
MRHLGPEGGMEHEPRNLGQCYDNDVRAKQTTVTIRLVQDPDKLLRT